MKIVKKPKFKKITCPVCDCVFVPSSSDILVEVKGPYKVGQVYARCPVCLSECRAWPRRRSVAFSDVIAQPKLVIENDAAEKETRCGTCKYTNFTFEDEPCCDCHSHSKWEALS